MPKYLFLPVVSIMFFLQSCSSEMQVDYSQLQVDTVKSSYTYKKEFIKGMLRLRGDTVYSNTSGKARFCLESGQNALASDTVLIVNRSDFFGNETQHDYLLKKLSSLQIKTHHLQQYLRRHLKSVEYKNTYKKIESMPDMDVSYSNRDDDEDGDTKSAASSAISELKKHNKKLQLHKKIERLNKEIQRIEKQISRSASNLVQDYIQTKQTGYIQYLVRENQPFSPGTPLFRVEAPEAGQFIVHLKETPQEDWLPEVEVFVGQKKLKGKLVNNMSGDYDVIVQTSHLKKESSGQPVKVKLFTKPQKKLLLKKPALNYDGENSWVFCRKDDEFRKVGVEIKPYSGSMVEIISGIHENAQIIVSSSLSIWNKDRLKVKDQYAKN